MRKFKNFGMEFPLRNRLSIPNHKALSLLGSIALAAGSIFYTTKIEPGWLEISTIAVKLPRLHPVFNNYRIVHISDIHMGTWITKHRLAKIVKSINMLFPDLIVITGDFVTDLNHTIVTDLYSCLCKLRSKDGAFAVLGNHDYWSNPKTIRQILEISGIIDLPNKVHSVKRGNEYLHIVGVDDYWENKASLMDVIGKFRENEAAILLAHEPDFAEISSKSNRFDLQLSGHTHGGQVILPKLGPIVLPKYGRKYPAGLYQIEKMLLYTNRGLGTGHPKIRFRCRPEIALLTLHAPVI